MYTMKGFVNYEGGMYHIGNEHLAMFHLFGRIPLREIVNRFKMSLSKFNQVNIIFDKSLIKSHDINKVIHELDKFRECRLRLYSKSLIFSNYTHRDLVQTNLNLKGKKIKRKLSKVCKNPWRKKLNNQTAPS